MNKEITYKKLEELIKYEKNPRNNKNAIDAVANSIKEFGFQVPIVIDKDNVIVCGHTRYEASLKLGLEEVPCIIASELTEEQIKAFRLADNKVSEFAEWDFRLLNEELEEILDIDMSEFGFELDLENDEENKAKLKHQEMRTDDTYNLVYFDPGRTEGRYQMPTLKKCLYRPKKLLGFNYALSTEERDVCVHFYLDDYQFERIWNDPVKYIDLLQEFQGVMTPSYSVYMDMSEPIKIYNVFRSRLLGQMLQDAGLNVIPIVYWSDEKSFDYCFDGLPENSCLSVYTVGTSKPEIYETWKKGMDELIKRKKPKIIILYGNGLDVDYDFGNIEIIKFKNEVTERMKENDK